MLSLIIVTSVSLDAHKVGSEGVLVKEQLEAKTNKQFFTESELKDLAYAAAERFGANKQQVFVTARCEAPSQVIDGTVYYNAYGKSEFPGEESYGLAMWNIPSGNPNFEGTKVTKEQAQTATYSLNLMASYFSKGKQNLWTCYRNNFGRK